MSAKFPKVSLRPPESGDFEVLSQLRNDPSIQRQLMISRKHSSPREVRAWIKRRTTDPQGVFFVVDAGGPSGFVQLTRIDREAGVSDLGICLTARSRGKGTATAAMRLLERYARRELCGKKMTLHVLRINHRAIAFYRKAGFRDVRIDRRDYDDGERLRDVLFMEKRLQ